jgi:hypothetical protein
MDRATRHINSCRLQIEETECGVQWNSALTFSMFHFPTNSTHPKKLPDPPKP